MIKVEMVTENPLYILKDANCITIGKRAKRDRKEAHEEAKRYFLQKLIEEHSTVEWIHFRIIDEDNRGDIASHITRHSKGLPRFVVQSSRPDWNKGAKRKPLDETFIKFGSLWNPLAFINMCRQRLCNRASEIDRAWLRVVLDVMKNSNDPFFEALEMCCVPNCVYRGYCPEQKSCGKAPSYEYIMQRYAGYKENNK